MSDSKIYTAAEVAKMILEKTHNTLKKHEELLKSKNSAHEIDLGEEPKNDEAECPESLKSKGAAPKSESSENKAEAPKSEAPKAEESPAEEKEEEKEESSEESEENDEEKKPEKFFKKAESGMFTVQYNRLAKEEQPQYHIRDTNEGKKEKKNWTKATRKEIDYSRSGMKNSRPSNAADQQKFEAEAKERSKKLKEEAASKVK